MGFGCSWVDVRRTQLKAEWQGTSQMKSGSTFAPQCLKMGPGQFLVFRMISLLLRRWMVRKHRPPTLGHFQQMSWRLLMASSTPTAFRHEWISLVLSTKKQQRSKKYHYQKTICVIRNFDGWPFFSWMKNCSLLTEFHLSVVVDRRIKETEEIIYYIQGVFDYCCLVRLEKVTVCENCPKKSHEAIKSYL